MSLGSKLAWASSVLQLDLTRLEQLQSGAVYCQLLDAFNAAKVDMTKVNFDAQLEHEMIENYRLLSSALESAGLTKFLDRQRLMMQPAQHEDLLSWFRAKLAGMPVPDKYDPADRRRSAKGGRPLHGTISPALVSVSTPRAGRPSSASRQGSMTPRTQRLSTPRGALSAPRGTPPIPATPHSGSSVTPKSLPRQPPASLLAAPRVSSGDGASDTENSSLGANMLAGPPHQPGTAKPAVPSGRPLATPRGQRGPNAQPPLTPRPRWNNSSTPTPPLGPLAPRDAQLVPPATPHSATTPRMYPPLRTPRPNEEPLGSAIPCGHQAAPAASARAGTETPRVFREISGGGLQGARLGPSAAARLAAAGPQLEEGDVAARAAVTSALRALPELERLLHDMGSADRDGYLHRGKLRSRRGMMGLLVSHAWELLQDVHQLSALAGLPGRARARHMERLFKELGAANETWLALCARIENAERFFPVPGGTQAVQLTSSGGETRQLDAAVRAVCAAKEALAPLFAMEGMPPQWSADPRVTEHLCRAFAPVAPAEVPSVEAFSDAEEDGASSLYSDVTASTAMSSAALQRPPARPVFVPPLAVAPAHAPAAAEMAYAAAMPAFKAGVRSRVGDLEPHSPVADSRCSVVLGAEPEQEPVDTNGGMLALAERQAPQQAEKQPVKTADAIPTSQPYKAAKKPSAARKLRKALAKMFRWKTPPSSGMSQAHHTNSPAAKSAAPAAQELPAPEEPPAASQAGTNPFPSDLEPAVVLVDAASETLADAACIITCTPPPAIAAAPANPFLPATPPLPQHYEELDLGEGAVFKGMCVGNGVKHGLGTVTFPSGDSYAGDFAADAMAGLGVHTFAGDQGRYEGELANDVFSGVGKETFARGSTYVGDFVAGARHGCGTCHYHNGDYYEGEWALGLRHGRGMQQCTDDSNYVGDYRAGLRDGYGVYAFPNGDRYAGQSLGDLPHGAGVYVFASGQVHEGTWAAGRKHGFCVYTIGGADQWAGRWATGKAVWVAALGSGAGGPEGDLGDANAEGMEAAAEAAALARSAGSKAAERAAAYWAPDSPVQAALRIMRERAATAAAGAQEAARAALQVVADAQASRGNAAAQGQLQQ